MASCPTLRCEGPRFSPPYYWCRCCPHVYRDGVGGTHTTRLAFRRIQYHLKRREVFVCGLCVSNAHVPSTVARGDRPTCRPGFTQQVMQQVFFTRLGSAMLCASMAHTAEPDCGMWVHLLQKVVRPSPPDRPPLGRWPRRSVRCPSPPLSLCRKKVARTSASRLSEGFPQCQIMPQAALSFGQPRSISQLGRAGLPYRPCFRRGAVQRGRG